MIEAIFVLLVMVAGLIYVVWRKKQKIILLEHQLKSKSEDEEAHLYRVQHRAEVLHCLVDGIEDGLLVTNQNMEVIFANKSAIHLFPHVEVIYKQPISNLILDHRIVGMISDAVKSQRKMEQKFLVSGGQRKGISDDRFYSVEVIPIQREDPDNKDDVYLVIIHDHTEKYTLDKIRQDFVANASHELRTPLSIIIGYLENLLDGDLNSPDQQTRAFTVMKKHGDRLANIVEDLLVISRMESGHDLELNLQDFSFNECAKDVLHRLSPVIAAKKANIRISVESDAQDTIRGDRFYWDQILFNLVSNALKENDNKDLEIELSLKQEGKFSRVEVRDNGVGIPQMDLPFVFKRFYRVSRFRSPEVKGTGLGLSIVKRAIDAHQGKITVHSRPGIETVFTMLIPRSMT